MAKTCGERIVDLVSSLKLKKGDRLPGERELAELLKTSRNTVRESLITLAARGQIDIRKRSGCYLISTTPTTPWSSLSADVEAVMDALRAIGPHLAARVAKYAQSDQIRCLESATARIGQHVVNQCAAQLANEYFDFYSCLAGFAENPYLQLLMREIAAARQPLMSAVVIDKSKAESFFELHVSLLQAIKGHDAGRSQLLSAHGLDAFAAMLRAQSSASQTSELP